MDESIAGVYRASFDDSSLRISHLKSGKWETNIWLSAMQSSVTLTTEERGLKVAIRYESRKVALRVLPGESRQIELGMCTYNIAYVNPEIRVEIAQQHQIHGIQLVPDEAYGYYRVMQTSDRLIYGEIQWDLKANKEIWLPVRLSQRVATFNGRLTALAETDDQAVAWQQVVAQANLSRFSKINRGLVLSLQASGRQRTWRDFFVSDGS